MAFMETPRFPDDIAQGSVGGPGYSTDVTVMFSGHEARNINWSRARGRWEASSAVRTAADFDAVRSGAQRRYLLLRGSGQVSVPVGETMALNPPSQAWNSACPAARSAWAAKIWLKSTFEGAMGSARVGSVRVIGCLL